MVATASGPKTTFEDLSGVAVQRGDNPYDALISVCDGSSVRCDPFIGEYVPEIRARRETE
jgi:hypothetical protein